MRHEVINKLMRLNKSELRELALKEISTSTKASIENVIGDDEFTTTWINGSSIRKMSLCITIALLRELN
jgi:hypothetical protein